MELDRSIYLTPKEAAEFFRCNLSTVWRWQKQGMFNKYSIGSKTLYKREELEKAIKPL